MAFKENIVVLDTDVLIYIMKKDIIDDLINKYNLALTFITLYEYLRGLARIKEPSMLPEIKKSVEELFLVIWPTNKTVVILSKIWAELSKEGILIDDRDLFIGTLCIENNLPLSTFNKTHFNRLKKFGLKLVEIV